MTAVGLPGLEEHGAGFRGPRAGDLGSSEDRRARGSRQRQAVVGRQDADQVDAGEVVPLGQHLGADQDVGAARGEGRQDRAVAAAGAGGVLVEPQDARLGEVRRQRQLEPLGPRAPGQERRAAAVRAGVRFAPREAAVVAEQLARAQVHRQRDVAVRAGDRHAAGRALQDAAKPRRL
jgi:hypothetical protein